TYRICQTKASPSTHCRPFEYLCSPMSRPIPDPWCRVRPTAMCLALATRAFHPYSPCVSGQTPTVDFASAQAHGQAAAHGADAGGRQVTRRRKGAVFFLYAALHSVLRYHLWLRAAVRWGGHDDRERDRP